MSTNRHTNTLEQRGIILQIDISNIPSEVINTASNILNKEPSDRSTWFTRQAIKDYQAEIRQQMTAVKYELKHDPHSRRIVMFGPIGACWLSTQLLSLPTGGYGVFAAYRSLDIAHANIDGAFQYLLGQEITNNQIKEVTLMVGSYHAYL